MSRSLGIHALIDNMVSFISGDVGLAPAFKEPEESMSTSPQATILAMEQQQSRAEVLFLCLNYCAGKQQNQYDGEIHGTLDLCALQSG